MTRVSTVHGYTVNRAFYWSDFKKQVLGTLEQRRCRILEFGRLQRE